MDLEQAFRIPDLPVETVNDPAFTDTGLSLSVLRTDLVHPGLPGNKWFKLKNNLLRARHEGHDTLLSFGGPWSNHLHALARAGQQFGFRTIGVVRGELPPGLNPCLQDAAGAGMFLVGLPRHRYRIKHEDEVIGELRDRFGDFFLIPEGGANREGALGCAEIVSLYDQSRFDLVCMACGTGTMLTGMASRSSVPLMGFQVMRGEGYLERTVAGQFRTWNLQAACPWSINAQFHFGGFGKTSTDLLAFMSYFEGFSGIPLEPVYAAKVLYGLYILKKRDFFPRSCSILFIHGGGLQGRRGFV